MKCRTASRDAAIPRRPRRCPGPCESTLACLLAVAACGPANSPSDVPLAAAEWHEFQGTWTATGNRHRDIARP